MGNLWRGELEPWFTVDVGDWDPEKDGTPTCACAYVGIMRYASMGGGAAAQGGRVVPRGCVDVVLLLGSG